jgi:hypothetical protein
LLSAALLFASIFLEAQSISTVIGGRVMGMGNAGTCITDEWALFNNIGGLAKVEQPTTACTYEAHPVFPAFNRMAMVFSAPVGPGVVAAGVYRFGDELYNEQIASAGFSNSLGLASLGAKINFIQYTAEGFGTANAITISFGGIARLTEKISVGAYITNLNQPKLSRHSDEILPTSLNLGVGCQLSEKLFITSEIEKDLQYPITWKNGMEYRFSKKFAARTGFDLYPKSGHAGFEFSSAKLRLTYGYRGNDQLGSAHQATVGYTFKKRK